jgi:hypothetical protein
MLLTHPPANKALGRQLILLPSLGPPLAPEPLLIVAVLQLLERFSLLRRFHEPPAGLFDLFLLRRQLLHKLLASKRHLRAVARDHPDAGEIDRADQVRADLPLGCIDGLLHLTKLILHRLLGVLLLGQLALALALGAAALLKNCFVLELKAGHNGFLAGLRSKLRGKCSCVLWLGLFTVRIDRLGVVFGPVSGGPVRLRVSPREAGRGYG